MRSRGRIRLISKQMNWVWTLTFLLAVFWFGVLIAIVAGYQSQLGFSLFTARYALIAAIIPLAAWLLLRLISIQGKAKG